MRTLPAPILISREDLQALLGLPASTFFRLLAAGKLPPSILLGRRRYWHRDTVERWLAEREGAR